MFILLQKSLVSSLVSRLVRTLDGGGQLLARYFTDLDSSAMMSYDMTSPVVLTGDFESQIQVASTLSAGTVALLGQAASSANRLRIEAGVIKSKVDNTSFAFTTPTVTDGKLHTITFKRVGTVVSVIVDGVSYPEDGALSSTGSFVVEVIGKAVTTYAEGYLANLKITDGTTLVGVGWAISGDEMVATSVSGFVAFYQTISLSAGITYEITYTVTSASSGEVRAFFEGGTTVNGIYRNSTGTYTEL